MGVRAKRLTDWDRKRLAEAEERIRKAELAWVKLVRELGIGAVARDSGTITSAGLSAKVRRIERGDA
jgi:hypothetical protein